MKKNLRPFLVLLICCLLPFTMWAQGHGERLVPPEASSNISNTPSLMVKYSLTSMIEPTPTFQLAVEHCVSDTKSFQYELGYITSYPQVDIEQYWGLRARGEWRNYFKPLRYNTFNPYWAIEAFGQYNQSVDNFWYCKDDCSYYERFLRNRARVSLGLALEYGWMRLYEERFLLDIVTGAGIKHAQIVSDDISAEFKNASVSNNAAFNILNDMSVVDIGVNFILGIKIGYIIK